MHIALSFAPAHRKHLVHRTELGPCTSHSSLHIALVKEFKASSGCDLCLASTHNIWQQVGDRQPPPARPLLFPPALQAPAVTPALVGDAAAAAAAAAAAPAAAAVAAPAQTADVTAPVVAAGGVKRKTVADAASALEDLLENAAQGRKLVAAKKSGKDAKVKAKAKAKAKATAATTKGKGEGSPAIIVVSSAR